ncbi:MAG: 50S ribosomal protein L13 [Candidatus Levybacteria bacterium]|nr:50S ribosomal protein L13 [Candidatus Levybacteria bacterium]
MNITKATKQSDIKRDWHLIDVKGQTLGRISTKIANLLMGKSKPYFVRNLDCGDYVVVINAKEIKVTGRKETDKKYYRHSGYPGGFRAESFKDLREKNPSEIVKHAVRGMLPQNRLRDRMLKRLFAFSDEKHTYQDRLKKENN